VNKISEHYNGFRGFYGLANTVLKPALKSPKAAILFTLHRNWRSIVGNEFYTSTKIDKITLIKNQKIANLHIISFDSYTSFYLNNNKSYILENINNYFGYRAIINLYMKEMPREIIKNIIKQTVDEVKLEKFISMNNVEDNALREKLNELAKEVCSVYYVES
jgi:hypothetical protein